ncbi:MAG: glycosyltransferase family 4 protein [Planctomycetes bacterium]|nr:glycosyltransferase family 4 protein [Planctomycetota bacterium]
MNVLFLTNNPNLGSTARILQSWLLLGRQDGLHGRVIARSPGDFTAWLKVNAVETLIDPMPWPDRRWPIPGFWHAWKVARWARRARVEVIHCNEHDVYPFAVMLRWLLRCPLVCHVRFRIEPAFSTWAFGGRGRCPDALLWTSRQQREDCAGALGDTVPSRLQHLVPLGLDLQRFGILAGGREETRRQWGFRPDEIVIGSAAPLRPRKRVEDFITLVDRLCREDERVVGVLAGDAPPGDEGYRVQILSQIEATGLGRRLRWLGNLEPVEPFYHGIDVFVSTSTYETFGNTICEAMACRRPVAAYRGGSVHEVAGDAGRVVETGDLNALTEAVRSLVRQPARRAELGDQGFRRVADEFNPAKTLTQLRAIYDSLL